MRDEGWENDFFMASFHNLARTNEEQRAEFRSATVGEPFFESDPDAMTKAMREVDKPCLGFKILAAGRRCANETEVAAAFKYAFDNIKGADAVIVGMFPYFQDEVAENVAHVARYG